MLDEGKIDRDEYERLKEDLMAETAEPENPMEGKPPGWYSDPSGKAQHQAYWDGEKWTGETRTEFQARVAEAKPRVKTERERADSRRNRRVLLVVVALIVVAVVAANAFELDSGPPQVDEYIGEYGGERLVYNEILGSNDCAELQETFDRAANNNDRETPGTRLFDITLGYMTAADDRMEYVGCYD